MEERRREAAPQPVIIGPVPAPARRDSPLAERLPRRGAQPRILILRLSALGDLVFATALLQGLRARWPRAYIGWLAQSGFAGLLENDPRLDALIRVDTAALRRFGNVLRLRRELASHRFDWVLDAQGLAKSRLLAALVPGAHRIGFESKEPAGFLMQTLLPKGGDIRRISSEYRFLAEALTGQPPPPPSLPVSAAQLDAVQRRMAALGLAPGFIALCPFTTRPQKHWMAEYWPQLAALLPRPCVIFGGPGDVEPAERIAAQLPATARNLTGRTKLSELPAWLRQAGLVIGVDTGLTHIGVAVHTPVLALFGSTCPYTTGAASPLTVLYDALPCAPCRRNPTCGGRFDCLRGITPQRVADAARQLLQAA